MGLSDGDGSPVAPDVRRAMAPLVADPSTSAIVTDFDGTLAPIVDDPAGARALEGAAEVLSLLADRYAVVAVVSGRSASFLSERLVPPAGWTAEGDPTGSVKGKRGVRLVGLYGMEWAGADGVVTPVPEAERWRPVVAEVAGRLRSTAPPGVVVESKGLAVTVHWRQGPQSEAWVKAEAAAVAARSGLRAYSGRMSVELRAPLDIDKGTATRRLVEGCSAACFLGDDVGDLPAFAALCALAIEEGMTTVGVGVVDDETAPEVAEAADVVIAGPTDALALLGWMAAAAAGPT